MVARYSHMQTKDTSSRSAPDTSKFIANHSGKLKVVSNYTKHGYGGFQQNMIIALQIGQAMGSQTVGRIQDEAKAEFMEIMRDYGQEGIGIKTKNGDKISTFHWNTDDGSNYAVSGASI